MEICPLYDTSIIPRETEYRVPFMDRSICLVANDMIIETLVEEERSSFQCIVRV